MLEKSLHQAKRSHIRWKGMLRNPKRKPWPRLWHNVAFISFAFVCLIVFLPKENAGGSIVMSNVFRKLMYPALAEEAQRQWSYGGYDFHPNVSDWDQQRATWMKDNPESKRSRVLMVSGSSPEPCEPSILGHMLLRAGKNKLDYCRMHDMELYYSLENPDLNFSDEWVKLPIIRMLMLQHPEYEWIWWLDVDAVVTNMSFEPPIAELEQYNLVLRGEDRLVYGLKDWRSLSTANFMIRNCQWSLDLLSTWASMGTASAREESGAFQTDVLANRPLGLPGDDQSSLVVMLSQDKTRSIRRQTWVPKVKLMNEGKHFVSPSWKTIESDLEENKNDTQEAVPFVTHFAGCLPVCTAEPELLKRRSVDCVEHLERAFDFADNQIYGQYGFKPRTLGKYLEPLVRYSPQTENSEEQQDEVKSEEEFRLVPEIDDWNERRKEWMEQNPSKKEEVLLVSGSKPRPCEWKHANDLLLRGFKNRIDYGREHRIKVFYNMAVLDKNLPGWWTKLPLLKMLMVHNPGVEWIWWMDSDAVLTDLKFSFPFERYNSSGYNLVMYGNEGELFKIKSYTSINTGNLLIRNCQWSFDLLDRWASLGATRDRRVKNEAVLNNVLARHWGWEADDQSVLAYLLVTQREKWAAEVCFEMTFAISGNWLYFCPQFVDGLTADGPQYRPFMTHFAGCHPCKEFPLETCLVEMRRTYHYADNQVLFRYGFAHEQLNSSAIHKI